MRQKNSQLNERNSVSQRRRQRIGNLEVGKELHKDSKVGTVDRRENKQLLSLGISRERCRTEENG